jgi:hypothetical protein
MIGRGITYVVHSSPELHKHLTVLIRTGSRLSFGSRAVRVPVGWLLDAPREGDGRVST